MYRELNEALNSINFLDSLSKSKKGYIKDITFEIHDLRTLQDALIVKNILLLLNEAHRLENLKVGQELNIVNWITIKKEDPNAINTDAVDALRYAFGKIDYNVPNETITKLAKNNITLDDINAILDKEEDTPEIPTISEDYDMDAEIKKEVKEEMKPVYNSSSKYPEEFFEDMRRLNTKELAEKYNRSVSTIRRWKRELSK